MNETRTALSSLTVAARRVGEARDLFEDSALSSVVAQLNIPTVEPRPQGALLEEVRRNLIAAARSVRGVASAKRRDLKQAPWLLWTHSEPLIELEGLLASIYADAETSGRMRSRLIEAWISACDPSLKGVEDCGRRLAAWASGSDDLRFATWRQAQERFDFFDPRRGPAKVAREVLHHSDPVPVILKAAGLDETRASTGYARHVQEALLADLPKPLAERRGDVVLERAQAFLVIGAKLRFLDAAAAGGVANALLAPWRVGARSAPTEDVRQRIQDFLLRHLGDPRSKPENWALVDKQAVGLIRGWLARANLEAFFDVVADNADENFRFRRAFWTACLLKAQQAGKYNDVWLALGKQVSAQASGIKELHGHFARLSGAQGVQSVFLMQIDAVVFGEWSHSGAVRAWPANSGQAPILGQQEYSRFALTRNSLPFPPNPNLRRGGSTEGDGLAHFSGPAGYWQGSVAELLRRRCGLLLEPKDYMPK